MSTPSSAHEEHLLPRIATVASQLLTARGPTGWPSRILVYADDSTSAGDALAAAQALAARSNAEVTLLSVFTPHIPPPRVSAKEGAARCEESDRSAAAELIDAVRREQRERFDGRIVWPVELEVGNAVDSIVQSAARTRADIAVLGLGSLDPLVRQQSHATPLSVARYCEIPVLAAARMPTALPQEGVLLLDSRDPDRGLVRAALHCLEDAAVLWLVVHGKAPRSADGIRHDPSMIMRLVRAVREEVKQMSRRIVVRGAYRSGDAADDTIAVAREVNADLIVAPLHGAAGYVRSLVANVADHLLLSATCSVLLVPDKLAIPR